MGVIDGCDDDGIEGDELNYEYTGGGERNRSAGGMGMVGAVGAAGAGDDEYPYYPRHDQDCGRDSTRHPVNEEEVSSSAAAAAALPSAASVAVEEEVVVPSVRV